MDEEKVRELELEIEELNTVQNEGENLDTVDGFVKFVKKQLYKICGKDPKRSKTTTPQQTTPPPSPERTERGQGDEDTDHAYNFNYPKRGLAVIINNEDFYLTKKYSDRRGSTYDEAALYQTFKNLGFTVWVKKNLTAWQIVEVLKLAKDDYDHASADCFACALLSHGDEALIKSGNSFTGTTTKHDLFIGIDGQAMITSNIVDIFSDQHCPSLKGKPRLFFIQACRGTKLDHGREMLVSKDMEDLAISQRRAGDRTDQGNYSPDSDMVDGHRSSQRDVPLCPSPLYKDCLIMYATPPGHFAWRRANGSWFMQTLCVALDNPKIGEKSLLNTLTQVVGKVAINYASDCPTSPVMHQKKETPVIETMLVKDVFFTEKL